jgi:hypothetical protein
VVCFEEFEGGNPQTEGLETMAPGIEARATGIGQAGVIAGNSIVARCGK